ncbi:unnamed protein product [Clavelina lepadiformis]
MFYAPWCGHCKSMEPTWLEVGAELSRKKSDVSVARLDATKYSKIASHFGIRGFPTIMFFKNGQKLEYNSARNKHSIMSFVDKASGPEVFSLHNKEEFLRARADYEVFFLFVGNEGTELFNMYTKAARAFFTTIKFFSVSDLDILPSEISVATKPTVLVFKDGKYYEMQGSPPNAAFVAAWVKVERFPSYNQLTGNSYHTLREAGRKFAIAAATKGDFFNQTMHNIALQRKFPYTFCWVDGSEILNRMTYSDITLPNLVVFDTNSYEFYVMRTEDRKVAMTKQNVLKFFDQIKDGTLSPQGGTGFMQQIKRTFLDIMHFLLNLFSENPLLASLVIVLPTVLIMGVCICLCSITDSDETGSDYEFDEDEELTDLDDFKDEGVEAGKVEEGDDAIEARNEDGENIPQEDLAPSDDNLGEGLRQRQREREEE